MGTSYYLQSYDTAFAAHRQNTFLEETNIFIQIKTSSSAWSLLLNVSFHVMNF